MKTELKNTPITLYGKEMKEVNSFKLLGDYISVNLEESVHETVLKRSKVAKHAIHEIRLIIEDSRADTLGGINVAFAIWEQAVLSMLLYNSESWSNISKKTFKILNDLFNTFYRCIFRIGTGTPIANFFWQVGAKKVENMILQKKLCFLHHLSNLEEGSLAKEILEIQARNSLGGIYKECEEFINKIGQLKLNTMSKYQWKKEVGRFIDTKNRNDLLQDIKKYKKLDYEQFAKETFGRKEYFYNLDLEGVRTRFRISSKMFPTIRKNFSRKYQNQTLTCPACSNLQEEKYLDTQDHVLTVCSAYSDLRNDLDLSEDKDLVIFFKNVLERRIEEGHD